MPAVPSTTLSGLSKGFTDSLVFLGLYRNSLQESVKSRRTSPVSKREYCSPLRRFTCLLYKALTHLPKHQLYNSCSNTLCSRIRMKPHSTRWYHIIVESVEILWFHKCTGSISFSPRLYDRHHFHLPFASIPTLRTLSPSFSLCRWRKLREFGGIYLSVHIRAFEMIFSPCQNHPWEPSVCLKLLAHPLPPRCSKPSPRIKSVVSKRRVQHFSSTIVLHVIPNHKEWTGNKQPCL